MTDPIRDELHRLNEEFSKLLGKSHSHATEKTTPQQLVHRFGLTSDEAKALLRHELAFVPSDVSYHESSNRRRVTRTRISVSHGKAQVATTTKSWKVKMIGAICPKGAITRRPTEKHENIWPRPITPDSFSIHGAIRRVTSVRQDTVKVEPY
jgi:hypothetical protein